MRDVAFYVDDPAMTGAREAHRLLWEPADDDRQQLYVATCSCGGWEPGRKLDAHAVQEEFDVHMGNVQLAVHAAL
ncbi:hypothetical protein ABZT26_35155 [Streptomyces sp. NPDC005395]|uniref:hypothetical protein n=1 Tax=Streptomyces sp. NPDC005395 TaxID=3157042 RepID=UPI0033B3BEEB